MVFKQIFREVNDPVETISAWLMTPYKLTAGSSTPKIRILPIFLG
jgi:hypothetical protein